MKITNSKYFKTGMKMGKFLLAGAPSFLIAIPLNVLLVDYAHLVVPLAYAIVLILQVSANYFMCRWFVFKKGKKTSLWIQFWQFLSGILVFRLGDWALYFYLTSILSIHYVVIQVFNAIVFFVFKYLYSRKVME